MRSSSSDGRSAEHVADLEVNEPLRLPGASVYLLGHGSADPDRYTDKYGAAQTTASRSCPTTRS